MEIKKTVEFSTKAGQAVTINIVVERGVCDNRVNCDGDILVCGKLVVATASIKVYADGKLIDKDFEMVKLASPDANGAVARIGRVKLSPEKYELVKMAFDQAVAEAEQDEAYQNAAREAADKAKAVKIAAAKRIIAKAEKHIKPLPTRKQAAQQAAEYNRVMNEGGSGYVPDYLTQEDYQLALDIVNAESRE